MRFPVLCIHDSFVIGYNHATTLKFAMTHAAKRVLGKDVTTKNYCLGLDEVRGSTSDRLDDYINYRYWEPTAGYVTRKRRFEKSLVYLGKRSSTG
jgi:hypothetical protein